MASTNVSDYLPYVRDLREEHRKIGKIVEQIQMSHFLEGLPTAKQDSQVRTDALLKQFRALHTLLQNHFDEEETGGCLEEAISRLPHLAAEWCELETELRDLLEQLQCIIDTVLTQGFGGQSAETIERDFNAFAEVLYDHEADENRLIEQGFNVGSEDALGSRLTPSL